MKMAIAMGILAALAASASAATTATGSSRGAAAAREIGVGVVLGEPIGVTAKLWMDDRLAFDAGAGLSDGNAGFWGDALWHDWTLLPQPAAGRLGAYAGAGPHTPTGADARCGGGTMGGVSFRPNGHPRVLYAYAGPLFRMTQGGHVDAVGGVGIRLMAGGKAR